MVAEPAAVRRLGRGAGLSAIAGRYAYSAADRQRWVIEPDKRGMFGDGADRAGQDRAEFARDRARVLHSYAFRRLADKTQVVSPGQDDFPRTRLTHSLEVAQIAREIGDALGCDPDVADTAGLAHDLGHPPFGHNGEDALNQVAAGIGGFEGNAQTLRLLTRLEAKVLSDGRSAGLNLTRASLDAACKYPWPAGRRAPKFGFYEQDRTAFEWVRDGRPDGVRCLEAQVMDWSDDVAYSVHDVEDGVHSGLVKLAELTDDDLAELCEHAALRYSTWPATRLAPVLAELLALPALRDLAGYDGSFAAQASAKRATSELTGRFAGAAVSATRAKHGDVALGRYSAELIVPDSIAAECALLKAIAYRYVMQRSGVSELLAEQRRTLTELADALYEHGVAALSTVQHDAWRQAGDDAERLRVVVDQIAQLTDSAALNWHARLVRPDGARRN